MIRGWRRWYPVESVRIEGAGQELLQEQVFFLPAGGIFTRSPTEPAQRASE